MEEEKLTATQAAAYLDIPVHRIYDATKGGLVHEKYGDVGKGPRYFFRKEDLDAWTRGKEPPTLSTALMLLEDGGTEEKERDEQEILSDVLASLFAFLTRGGYRKSLLAMRELSPPLLRIWDIATPDCSLYVVVEGQGPVSVVALPYLHYLEQTNQALGKQVKEKETTLSFLRKRTVERVLTEYSEDILVLMEPREEGFFVKCARFPFGAFGDTEEEALKVFRGLLFGYTYHLGTHEAELTPLMKEQFHALKSLRVED